MPGLCDLPAFFPTRGSSGKILNSVLPCGQHIRGIKVEVGKPMNRLFSGPGSWSQGGGCGRMSCGMLRRKVGFGGGVDRWL